MSQEFEGQEISEYIAAIPAMKLEAPDSYQRGTYLTLQVEVRVRSVRYEEVTSGKHKGDLVKIHVLAVENVNVMETVTPQQRQALLEAAAEQLAGDTGVDGSSSEPSVDTTSSATAVPDEPAAVLPQPVDKSVDEQMTPDTLTETAQVEESDSGWEYPTAEYVREDEPVSVGF